ncbi:hypothetical protein [Olleya sp. HaHaR_3_96]|uniref:hypothetical protein n=1 Tax=Olleya sp. HaHaR_3_96 TaxID=2745560 RepID=UPI001C4EE990|nr:hypothetical protein [Olleya sp. HaHaR_3_96]
MKSELKYIELKSGFSDNGNAWIGLVSFSKSGKTVYFNGKAFQTSNGTGVSGNYFDLESGDEYWISGVKKDMSDRHQFGGGKIFVEKRILNDYLQVIGRTELPKSGFELTEVDTEKPIERINELENSQLEKSIIDESIYTKTPKELTNNEIEFLIEESIEDEKNAMYNKGRRAIRRGRIELETELEKRKEKTV